MTDSPLVSVIMPAYNAATYVDAALQSAVDQTMADLEVLVIDDGSSDATPQLVEAWVLRDPRIRLIRRTNSGVSSARNHGLQVARGRYIAFLDSDDLWEAGKLEAQLEAFQDGGIGLVHTGVQDIDAQGAPCPPSDHWLKVQGPSFGSMLEANGICCSSVMLDRALVSLSDPVFAVGRLCEDWLLWGQVAANHAFGYIDRPLVRYRVHPGGTSSNHMAMIDGELQCRLDLLALADQVGSVAQVQAGKSALFRAYYYATKHALRLGLRDKALAYWKQAIGTKSLSIDDLGRMISVLARFVVGYRPMT